jgi:hypothetical protein
VTIVSGLHACDIINPEESIPTTFQVEPFTFQAQPGQGSGMNEINEVWVYANSNFLGAFAPPVNVYYYGEGATTLTCRPGIRNNGIAADAIVYPLFTGYTINLDVSPGSSHLIQPGTGYSSQAGFSFIADFELSNPFTDDRDTVSASMLVPSTDDVFEGTYSGKIDLSEEAYFIEVTHEVVMGDLPTDGKDTYLELRYKNDVEFGIGLLGSSLQGESYYQFIYLTSPSAEWNMLYLDLTDWLKASNLDGYKILFRAIYTGDGEEKQQIYFDNIKVVHL